MCVCRIYVSEHNDNYIIGIINIHPEKLRTNFSKNISFHFISKGLEIETKIWSREGVTLNFELLVERPEGEIRQR